MILSNGGAMLRICIVTLKYKRHEQTFADNCTIVWQTWTMRRWRHKYRQLKTTSGAHHKFINAAHPATEQSYHEASAFCCPNSIGTSALLARALVFGMSICTQLCAFVGLLSKFPAARMLHIVTRLPTRCDNNKFRYVICINLNGTCHSNSNRKPRVVWHRKLRSPLEASFCRRSQTLICLSFNRSLCVCAFFLSRNSA